MIVNNLNLIGIAIAPDEANPPLIVYANTILTLAIACQFLKPVGGRHSKIL
jgi:hypothetical protein